VKAARTLVFLAALLFPAARAFADDSYAVILYRSGGSALMLQMTSCGEKSACLDFVGAAADDEIWRPDNKGCVGWQALSDDQKKMFLGRPLAQPYITYDDREARHHVIFFFGAQTAALDGLTADRVDVLKARGHSNVVLVADRGYLQRKARASEPPPNLSQAFGRAPAQAKKAARAAQNPLSTPLPAPPFSRDLPELGNLGLRIATGSSAEPVRFEGEYTFYAADGGRVRRKFEGAGDTNYPIEGRGIRAASLHRTSDEGWVRLEVVEDGRAVFDRKTEDGSPLNYRAGR